MAVICEVRVNFLIQKLPPIPGRNKWQFKSSNMLP